MGVGDMKTIYKILFISICLTTLISCTLNTASYNRKASKVLDRIQSWYDGPITDYDNAMSAYIDDEGEIVSQGSSGGVEVLKWYLFAESIKSINGQHYDGLIKYLNNTITPITQQIKSEGFSLLSEWNTLSPPPELLTAHNQIRDCIEYELNKYNEIEESYSSSSIIFPKLSDDNPCSFYDNAVDMIYSH